MNTKYLAPAVAVLLALSACATPASTKLPIVGPQGDVLGSLPGGEVARATVAPYGFGNGLGQLVAVLDAPPQRPIARLALSRALVDAVLYGEITQDGALLEALGARDAWGQALALLEPTAGDAAIAKEQSRGRALIGAMRSREMNPAYHDTLEETVASGGVWEVEARVARLLDLEEVMLSSEQIPEEQRLPTILELLGANEPGCLKTAPLEGVEPARRDVITLGHCGAAALGWPEEAEAQLLYPELAALTSLMARGTGDLRGVLARTAHPLVADARGDIEALGGRLASLRIPVGLDPQDSTDFPDLIPGGRGSAVGIRPYVVVDIEGNQRVGVPPLVSLGPDGARFVEAEVGLSFPGALCAPGQLPARLTQASELLGFQGAPLVFVPAGVRVRSAANALRDIRAALPLHARGELLLALFDGDSGLLAVRVGIASGSEPTDRVVTVDAEGTVEWPEDAGTFIVLRPEPDIPWQTLVTSLWRARQRVGTVLLLL